MKEAIAYQQADGSYGRDQVVIDAFDGDMVQFEEFLDKKLTCAMHGANAPKLPEPYEELYQQVYALELEWVKAHMPELRRKHIQEFGYYPIVAVGDE